MATPTGLSFPSLAHDVVVRRRARVRRAACPGRRCSSRPPRWRSRRLYLGVHYPSDVAAGAALGTADREPRPMMKVGIVGMPNAGKSSLFNALSPGGRRGGELPVHDDRAERRRRAGQGRADGAGRRTVGASNIVWDTIEFHDIAGLVAGASKGEGLGNKFLANIRESDALLHVVRAHHDDPNVIHPEGRSTRRATSRRSRPSCFSPTSSSAERRHATRRPRRPLAATARRSPRRRGCAR